MTTILEYVKIKVLLVKNVERLGVGGYKEETIVNFSYIKHIFDK